MNDEKKIKKLNHKIAILEKMIEDKTREIYQNNELLKEQQAKLMFNAKLASIGEMATSIAHEINNPIGIIEGQLRRLKYHIELEEHDKVNPLIGKIENNTHRVIKIIKGLRQLSKSSETESLKTISLKTFFEEFKDYNHVKTIDSNINVYYPDFKEDILILAKETSLAQIITNLINNSLDAIANSENPWIKIKLDCKEDLCQIKVTDSGDGIEKINIPKLFDPFFTTKEFDKGTGIGLNICKKLSKELEGDLIYQEDEGHTSFTLSLKCA